MSSDIEKLREILDKRSITHYDKENPSPPTIFQGHRGVWRTIVPFGRVFVETKGGKLGNVVAGNARLKGKTFDDAAAEGLKEINAQQGKKPARLRPTDTPKDSETKPRLKPVGGDNKPPNRTNPAAQGAAPEPEDNKGGLAGALAILERPGANKAEALKEAADALLKAARQTDSDLVRRRLEKLAYGLRSGSLKVTEVREQLKQLIDGGNVVGTPVPSQNEVNVLHDRVELQDTVERLQDKTNSMTGAKPDQVGGNTDDARNEAVLEILEALEGIIRTPQAKQQLKTLIKEVRSKGLGSKSVILRLLQILRFLMAVVPA
jgi:hypothetical protein